MGLKSDVGQLGGQAEAKKWLNNILEAALKKIVLGLSDQIQFVKGIRGASGDVLSVPLR